MFRKLSFSIITLLFLLLLNFPVVAQTSDELLRKISELESKVATLRGQEKTLSSQVEILNNQIAITKLNIESTEAKLDRLTGDIASVSGKIVRIEESLEQVSNVLLNRVKKTYIVGRTDPVVFLLTSVDFQNFLDRFEYLKIAQKHDKNLMYQMAASRKNYNDQKSLLENKKLEIEKIQAQLTAQKAVLDRQNREKQALLDVTRSDEARYASLLDQARRELTAVQTSQFTGKKDVKKGEIIGLMGSTGFSTGPHLHFGIYNLSESQSSSFNYNSGSVNPIDNLQGRNIYVESGACFEYSGSQNLGSGGLSWPMSNPRMTQCYGRTPYSSVYSNGRHEGIDLYDSGDITVKSVDDGVAYFYRGNSSFGNNVRIFHPNGKMSLYLHLQ